MAKNDHHLASPNSHPVHRALRLEDRLISLIENKKTIEKYHHLLEKMQRGALDVPGFFKSVAIDAAIELTDLMRHGENDKIRLEAVKDILDRAGYTKTQKVSINGQVNVDHQTSKVELVNLILSSARRAGIKVKEELPPKAEEKRVGPTIDVAPVAIQDKPPEGS